MDDISFSWDSRKNSANIAKHGISFEEAKTVFYDDFARVIFDPDHSETEHRFIILGMSVRMNVLVVVHCHMDSDSIIRIISARKATRNEKKQYREHMI